ncbi:MAG TPA: SIS domain-containing protein [Vicinamibacterales bacterium]|nr:SIS domain-containing protein [Vicinamibacterales bacterium]
MTDRDTVRGVLTAAADWHVRIAAERVDDIVAAANVIVDALAAGRKVLVFGNGGSATDAEHLATELVGRFEQDRRAWPVIALTSDSALVTAVANDYGFEAVFVRQIDALGSTGDVAIGITTSGRSANVTAALVRARERGLRTIALTGRDGGATGQAAEVHVNVPSDSTARVQEVQRTIIHAICGVIEAALTDRP